MVVPTWHDRKRYLWPLAVVMAGLPLAAVALHATLGWSGWLWLGPLVILVAIPLLDLVTGLDTANPPEEAIPALEADRYYRWVTYAFLPVYGAALLVGLWYLMTADLTVAGRIGLAVTIGMAGGLSINNAHELGHKREDVERRLARIALAPVAYGHFYVEHNRGHHVRVATPEDPASSRLGESFYAFWPRTVVGSVRSAWRLESTRLRRRNRRAWGPGNDVLTAWAMTAVLWAVLTAWLGVGVLPYLVLQAFVAFSLLEAVNYLEHYGLRRERVGAPGRERYERVEPRHSWNSNHVTTNVLLYHLQRHSDHHANPTRRYQSLRDFPDAPTLPAGYAGMILIAFVPPLWRKVMDRRLLAHLGGDVTRANIQPRRREAVLARYGTPTAPTAAAPGTFAGAGTAGQDAATATDAAAPAGFGVAAPLAARCPGCGYVYDQRLGAPREGFPPGTPFSQVPDTWCCPDCGVREKVDFVPVAVQSA